MKKDVISDEIFYEVENKYKPEYSLYQCKDLFKINLN